MGGVSGRNSAPQRLSKTSTASQCKPASGENCCTAGKWGIPRMNEAAVDIGAFPHSPECVVTEAHLFVIGILLAWLAGIRVYLTVFGVGLAGLFGWVDLPPALQATESFWVLGTSAALAVAEFFADKIPGVDSLWDLLQTLARVPAGAFLAAATLSPDGELGTGALFAGAGVALASHGLKAGTRALLNTSPEPASNWMASAAEDTVVVGGLALALAHPWLALIAVISASLAGALLVWIVWRTLWRGARWLLRAGAPAEPRRADGSLPP